MNPEPTPNSQNADTTELSGKMRGLKNLKPWPKGVSGCPAGRPRLSDKIKDELDIYLQAPDPKKARPRLLVLFDKLYETKPEILLYYRYGKPIESCEIVKPIELEVSHKPEKPGINIEEFSLVARQLFGMNQPNGTTT